MKKTILLDPSLLPNVIEQHYQCIDLRNRLSFEKDHIPTFTNIPIEEFQSYKPYLSKEIPMILLCYTGQQSYDLALDLRKEGYQSYSIRGGYYRLMQKKDNSDLF